MDLAQQLLRHKERRQREADAVARFEASKKAALPPPPEPEPKPPVRQPVVYVLDVPTRVIVVPATEVINATSAVFGIPVADIIGPSRRAAVAEARMAAMYAIRQMVGSTTTLIGRRFNGRDHTTVIHAIRATAGRVAASPHFAAKIADIMARAQAVIDASSIASEPVAEEPSTEQALAA